MSNSRFPFSESEPPINDAVYAMGIVLRQGETRNGRRQKLNQEAQEAKEQKDKNFEKQNKNRMRMSMKQLDLNENEAEPKKESTKAGGVLLSLMSGWFIS